MRSEYFNLKELKERKWTKSKIDKYLEPDKIIPNPMFRSASPSKLFLKSRVYSIEESEEFIEWLEKSKKSREARKQAMIKLNEEKRNKLIKEIDSLTIKIPNMSYKRLLKISIEHYNKLWLDRDVDKYATKDDEPKFLKRICINYLRHTSIYENELAKLYMKVGKNEGYDFIKEKINQLILEKYPELSYI